MALPDIDSLFKLTLSCAYVRNELLLSPKLVLSAESGSIEPSLNTWLSLSTFRLCHILSDSGFPPIVNSDLFHKGHDGREIPLVPKLLCSFFTMSHENLMIGLSNLDGSLGQYHNEDKEMDLLHSLINSLSSQSQVPFVVILL